MEIIKNAINGTAFKFVIPLVDAANRPDYKSSPTLAAGDVKVARYTSSAWSVANITSLPTAITGMTTHLEVSLTATEMTADDDTRPIIITFIDQTATKEWDDQTVEIRLGEIQSNLKLIDDNSVSNNTATLNLKRLEVKNTAGTAVLFKSDSGNGYGFEVEGNGTADGMRVTGGATSGAGLVVLGKGTGDGLSCAALGATGIGIVGKGAPGIKAESALSGNPNGFEATGWGTGAGMYLLGGANGAGLEASGGSVSGPGVKAYGQAGDSSGVEANGNDSGDGIRSVGGATGDGLACTGGSSSGNGIDAQSQAGNSNGIKCTGDGSGNAMHMNGLGSGNGLLASNGGSGTAFRVQNTSTGKGIHVSTVADIGLQISAGTDGIQVNGIAGRGAIFQGDGGVGMEIQTSVLNTDGMHIIGNGSGSAINLTTGSGKELDAKEIADIQTKIGTPVTIDGSAATLGGMLTKIADDNGGADFDATTDSLEKIATSSSTLDSQGVRDAMKLAPSGGAPAAGSVDTHLDDIETRVLALPDLTSSVDGQSLSYINELIMAMINGRYQINVPLEGQITFYKRDNTTTLTVVNVTTTERTRVV